MKKVFVWIMILSLCAIFTNIFSVIWAEEKAQQPEWNTDDKLKQIEQDIANEEKRGRSGLIKLASGAAVWVGGWSLFFPHSTFETSGDIFDGSFDMKEKKKGNSFLFYTSLTAGTVLEIWGWYQWRSASKTARTLKAKKYDISFAPTIQPGLDGGLKPALTLNMKF